MDDCTGLREFCELRRPNRDVNESRRESQTVAGWGSFAEILIYRSFSITIGILEGGRRCIMTSTNNNVTAGFGSRFSSFMYRGWKRRKASRRKFKSQGYDGFTFTRFETNALCRTSCYLHFAIYNIRLCIYYHFSQFCLVTQLLNFIDITRIILSL